MNGRLATSLIATALILPAFVFAAGNEDALHVQIRADLKNDPRSSQMSSAEIDSLVNALADQAQKDGTADDYLASKNTFNYATLFAPPRDTSFRSLVTSPMIIALVFLLTILRSVVLYIVKRRGIPAEMAPSNIEA